MGAIRWQQSPSPQLRLIGETRRAAGVGEYRGLEFIETSAKTIINKVPGGPRYGFEYTINPYRGCSHACTYCFARPTHTYLNLGAGVDFDTKIVVKTNAPDLVRAETAPHRWGGDLIAMGTNTDPYQHAEGKYKLTRQILEVLVERRNPMSILTKSPLVLRDLDILTEASQTTDIVVDFSIGTLDPAVWKTTEPGTPHPMRRIEAVARLNEAGISSGVLMGPVLPYLSDRPEQIVAVVTAAIDAGATSIGTVPLHLRPGVREHFMDELAIDYPNLVGQYQRRFAGCTNQRPDDQRAVSDLVRGAIVRQGGLRRYRDKRRSAKRPASPPSPAAQLSLGF